MYTKSQEACCQSRPITRERYGPDVAILALQSSSEGAELDWSLGQMDASGRLLLRPQLGEVLQVMDSPCLGGYIRDYRAGRGMPPPQKVLTIAALWITISATAWLAVSALRLRLALLALTVHLLWIPTCRTGGEGAETGDSRPAEEQEA